MRIPYSPEERQWIVDTYVGLGGDPRATYEAHRASGWPSRTYRAIETRLYRNPDMVSDIKAREDELLANARKEYSRTEKPDGTQEIKGPALDHAESWEDILLGVGLNPDDYTLIKLSLNIKEDSLTQSWVQVKPKVTTTGRLELLEDAIIRRLESAPPVEVRDVHAKVGASGNLLVLAIPDLHLGKLAWAPETGADYDLDIAANAFKTAVLDIRDRAAFASTIDKVQIPLGHDFFHVDVMVDGKVPSTFNGTAQDVDSRWIKAFDMGFELMEWAIMQCLRLAPVEVVHVPGNHDRTKSYMLGKAVQARFHNTDQVDILLGPSPRKYTRWGNVALMHTHGSDEKPANLARMFQTEVPATWGETLFREVLMGHLHHKKEYMDEDGAVLFNRLGSLSGDDAWHNEQGWKGAVKTARGIVYSATAGRMLDIHHNLIPSREERGRFEPKDSSNY